MPTYSKASNMKKTLTLIILLINCLLSFGQKKVSITIDDIPNTRLYQAGNFHSVLLERIDSMDIPVAIFINESKIHITDSLVENIQLLDRWVSHKNITLGNHSFSHPRYSEVGAEQFHTEIIKQVATILSKIKE